MDLSSVIPNDLSVTEFIMERFRGNEKRIGLIDGETGEQWTFEQIRQYIHALGSAYTRRGVKKGDVVVILSPNCPEHVVAMFAVQAIGGIVSGMNPVYTTVEISGQVQDSTASYVITHHTVLPKVADAIRECPNVKEIFVIGQVNGYTSISEMRGDDGSCYPHVKIDTSKDLALLPYSSGTTGLPKGVMLTHKAVISQIHLFSDYEGYRFYERGVTCISVFPYYHIGGYGFCASTLYQGCTSVVVERFEFERLLQIVQKYKIQTIVLPAPVLLRFAKDPLVDKYDLSSINSVLSGAAPIGEIVQKEISHRLNVQNIRQSYGMTEACGCTHVSRTDVEPSYGSAGACHPLITCKIMDVTNGRELLGPEERGEVFMRSPGVMVGYWKQPGKTADMLDKDGWIHSGDIGFRDHDGNFYIVDRSKELIKYKGFQVAPAELEALILTQPDVADVAVIGIPDERAGEVPLAYVVLKKGKKKDAGAIVVFVAERAAPYKHLRGGVHFRNSIPKNPSGKILRRKLRDQFKEQRKMKSKL